MNLIVLSDQATTINALFYIDAVKKPWRAVFDTNPGDKVTTDTNKHGVTFTVVGRRSQEIEKIELSYDDKKITVWPDKDGEYAPVIIYNNGRDYWTNQLRQKAMETGYGYYNDNN